MSNHVDGKNPGNNIYEIRCTSAGMIRLPPFLQVASKPRHAFKMDACSRVRMLKDDQVGELDISVLFVSYHWAILNPSRSAPA